MPKVEKIKEQLFEIVVNKQITTIKAPMTYDACLDEVRNLLVRQEQAFLVTAWVIGRLVFDAAESATYRDNVVGRLAADLGRSKSLLYDMKRLYEQYPTDKALGSVSGVSWSGVRLLTSVEDPKVRATLIEDVKSQSCTISEIKTMVAAAKPSSPAKKSPKKVANLDDSKSIATDAALWYFTQLSSSLKDCHEEILRQVGKLPEMLALTADEMRTSEGDYEKILTKGIAISATATSMSAMILNLRALKDANSFEAKTD